MCSASNLRQRMDTAAFVRSFCNVSKMDTRTRERNVSKVDTLRGEKSGKEF